MRVNVKDLQKSDNASPPSDSIDNAALKNVEFDHIYWDTTLNLDMENVTQETDSENCHASNNELPSLNAASIQRVFLNTINMTCLAPGQDPISEEKQEVVHKFEEKDKGVGNESEDKSKTKGKTKQSRPRKKPKDASKTKEDEKVDNRGLVSYIFLNRLIF